jgi:uncharacterized coiled-coil protein SlyX
MGIDAPSAAVICSAILAAGSAITTAIIKFLPQRLTAAGTEERNCHQRTTALETRIAIVETNYANFANLLADVRRDVHEMRGDLKQVVRRG